jgi:K+-transporting ATPase A subunit
MTVTEGILLAVSIVIVIVGGLIYFPMLILGPIGERIVR